MSNSDQILFWILFFVVIWMMRNDDKKARESR